MSDFETTEMKLRTTPTAGVAGEHSPYYRRLLSAGYKGFMQGTIGGAGLYGFIGLAIGTLVAIPAMFMFPALGASALLLIPATAGVGMAKGAGTFGNIGTVAAISAESADLAEQRRYLLDRFYELPNTPDGDKQAEAIKQELTRQNYPEKGRHLFHWKTVAICATIGALLALACCTPVGMAVLHGIPALHAMLEAHVITEATAVLTGQAAVIGTALGALMGSVIGIDRSYVRRWFDGTEKLLHDPSHMQEAMKARTAQVERIREAFVEDTETKHILERRSTLHRDQETPLQAMPNSIPVIQAATVANLDQPATKVESASLEDRIQKAMAAHATV